MNIKKWSLVGAGLLTLGLLVWAAWPQAPLVETARLVRGEFVRELVEDARTRVRERYTVSAPLAGQLDRPRVKAGDAVTVGQPVALLWPTASSLLDARSLAEQSQRVAAMQATLSRTLSNVARAQTVQQQAQDDFNRQSALAAQGFISPTQLETAQRLLTQRQQETAMARQEQLAAEHDLTRLRMGLSQPAMPGPGAAPWTVRSPVKGRVLKLHRDSEGPVTAGEPLMDIGDPAQMEVVTELLTQDAAGLPAQAQAILGHWGGALPLQAQLVRVEPGAFTKVSALGVEEQRVRAIFEPPTPWPEGLGDGYKLEIRIVVEQASQVPLAPVSAVFPHAQGHAVFTIDGGRARLHPVTLLGRNGQQAWLRTDLPEGALLVAYPPPTLREGERVRPQRP